jgi:Kef-type K+ transport system membrane component KefB
MDIPQTLLTIGCLFIAGLLADAIGRRTRLPRVTLLILLGVSAGPLGLNLLPTQVKDWYELLASVALTMVAFLLGGKLSRSQLSKNGREILSVSLSVVIVTVLTVGLGLLALGLAPIAALLLAGIATATAPAATMDVIRQSHARGKFTDTLQGIVAIDDAWGLIIFSMMLVAANTLAANGLSTSLLQGFWELFGAIGVGCLIGFPAAYLTGHLSEGEPVQSEALAIVFLCAGISLWLEVSFLLAGVTAGTIVVNFSRHHTRAFHEIENIEWPFLVLFFFLAGATVEMPKEVHFAFAVIAYIVLRLISRIAGGWIGARISRSPALHTKWMGMALMPQAGIAIGMALVAHEKFPQLGDSVLSIVVLATIFFELVGPLATHLSLEKVNEINERQVD